MDLRKFYWVKTANHKKVNYYVIPFILQFWNNNIIEMNRLVVARGLE